MNNVMQWIGVPQHQSGFEQGLDSIKSGFQGATGTVGTAMSQNMQANAEGSNKAQTGKGMTVGRNKKQ